MSTAEERSAERFREARAWAERALPAEDPGLAASSALTLKMLGEPVTAEAVLDRLKAQGREAK